MSVVFVYIYDILGKPEKVDVWRFYSQGKCDIDKTSCNDTSTKNGQFKAVPF